METVKIPKYMTPFECTINSVHYGPYAPGATVEVPAEVAALIKANAKLLPAEDPPETTEEMITRIVQDYVGARVKVSLRSSDVSEEAKDITDRFSYGKFATLSRDSFAEIELEFKYDSVQYITRSFYRAIPTSTSRNTLIFLAHHETEGVTDGVVLYKVYSSGQKVYGIAEKVLFDAKVVVTLTMTNETAATANMTTGEILAAMEAGKNVWVRLDNGSGVLTGLVTGAIEGKGADTGKSLRVLTTIEMSDTLVLVELYPLYLNGASGVEWGINYYVLTPVS